MLLRCLQAAGASPAASWTSWYTPAATRQWQWHWGEWVADATVVVNGSAAVLTTVANQRLDGAVVLGAADGTAQTLSAQSSWSSPCIRTRSKATCTSLSSRHAT